jgi:hypothetical protein
MFLEFVATDLTFGVKRLKHPLLLISGVDGDNQTFTGFRCFMPARQIKPIDGLCMWLFH